MTKAKLNQWQYTQQIKKARFDIQEVEGSGQNYSSQTSLL